MFQWAVSLEITGACPAPRRFSSELLNPLIQGLVISKDTRCLLQHIPPMAKRIPNQAACFSSQMRLSSASHLSDGWQESVFPTASAAQTVGEVVEDAPEHLNQNDDKNTQCLKTVCKTSPVNKLF